MTDIVERLDRAALNRASEGLRGGSLEVQAATEIGRLRRLVREALDSRAPDYIPGDWLSRAKEAVGQ